MHQNLKILFAALMAWGFTGLLSVGCSRTPDTSASGTTSQLSKSDTIKPEQQIGTADKPVSINNAVLITQLNHPLPGLPAGVASISELFLALYSPVLSQELIDTLMITGLYLAPVKNKEKTYCAVIDRVRRSSAQVSERQLDVFMFKDTNTSNIVVGHTIFHPEDAAFSLMNLSGSLFQLNKNGEYAISFEYVRYEPNTTQEQSRYVYLYRLSSSIPQALEQIFEYCTVNKTGESPNEQGEFTVQITDSSSISSQWKWGRELYTIVIIKTIVRKGDVDVGTNKVKTIKTKTHFEWIDGKYVEVFQQDLSVS